MNLLKFYETLAIAGLSPTRAKFLYIVSEKPGIRPCEAQSITKIASREYAHQRLQELLKLNLVSVEHRHILDPQHTWERRKPFPHYTITNEGTAVLKALQKALDSEFSF